MIKVNNKYNSNDTNNNNNDDDKEKQPNSWLAYKEYPTKELRTGCF